MKEIRLVVIPHSYRSLLWVIVLLGFLIRVMYTFFFQEALFGELIFKNGDTFSYVNPVFNLINLGDYTFDSTHPDSSYFRPPVYPFFWGLHYLLLGNSTVYEAVAFTQCIVDSFSILLIYKISRKLELTDVWSIVAAGIYAFNPFQIIWCPITATEILATFFALLITYTIIFAEKYVSIFCLGLLIGSGILLRQYLGVFLIIAIISVIWNNKSRGRQIFLKPLLLFVGVCLVMGPWVLRNWMKSDDLYVLQGETRGYYSYGPDAVAFESLFNKLDENITPYFTDAARHGQVKLEEFGLSNELQLGISEAVLLAHQCGPSFRWVRGDRNFSFDSRDKECEKNVIELFQNLRIAYLEEVGFIRYHRTKLIALNKALFKNSILGKDISNNFISTIVTILFGFRSIVVIMGFLSLLLFSKKVLTVGAFPLFMFFYIPVVTIHTEMRYLLQADAALIPLSLVFLCQVICGIRKRQYRRI